MQDIPGFFSSSNNGFAAVDVYANAYDPSLQLAPGVFTGTCNVRGGGCAWSGGAFTLVQQWLMAAAAERAGCPHSTPCVTDIRVNESNRPVWVPTNCLPTGVNGFLDNADSQFVNNNNGLGPTWTALDPIWQAAFVPWAAAQGFDSVSQFATRVWVAYDTQNYTDSVSYVQNVLDPLLFDFGNSIGGAAWAASAAHLTSLQGSARTTGGVTLGH